ncbi:MAG: hypothetical protein HY587_06350 [Candidatus Omnitrophica bacterium]|nr:hypothetical protein [Candidatus Omnitrophota bacterium]
MNIATDVSSDAKFLRAIEYVVPGGYPDSEWEHFRFPSGLLWEEKNPSVTEKILDATVAALEQQEKKQFVMKAYAQGKWSDYVRYDYQKPAQYARNEIIVRRNGDDLIYEEFFYDSSEPDMLLKAWEELFEGMTVLWLEKIREIPKIKTGARLWNLSTIAKVINEEYRRDLKYWQDSIQSQNGEILAGEEEVFDELFNMQQNIEDRFYEYWRKELRPLSSDSQFIFKETFRLDEDFFDIKKPQSEKEREIVETFFDAIRKYGGAHLASIFPLDESTVQNYTFKVKLVMPGSIIESNAAKVHENEAEWEFSFLSFLMQNVRLYARSKIR